MHVSLNNNGVKRTKNDFVNEFHAGINFEHLFARFFSMLRGVRYAYGGHGGTIR